MSSWYDSEKRLHEKIVTLSFVRATEHEELDDKLHLLRFLLQRCQCHTFLSTSSFCQCLAPLPSQCNHPMMMIMATALLLAPLSEV
jgi:hypothetical protein